MVETPKCPDKDPIQQLYEGLAAEARVDALRKPHNTDTWRFRRRPPLRFRASESGNCPRQIYYRLIGCVPAPDSPSLKLKQLEGNLAQDVVRQLFLKHGVEMGGLLFKDSGDIEETLNTITTFPVERGDKVVNVKVSARADGKINTPRGWALFEFKTMTANVLRWIQDRFLKGGEQRAVDYANDKYPYYNAQMQITMAVFRDTEEGGDQTYWGFKNKNTVEYGLETTDGDRAGLYLPHDEAVIDEILQKFALVSECVASETPPNLTLCPLDGSRECGWCPMHYQCYGALNNDNKVEYPA